MNPSFLLAFPLLLALSTPCSTCRCKFQHPQMYYCNSDIVMVVRILEKGRNTLLKRGFKVNITKILKAPSGIQSIHSIHSIYTPKRREDCGYDPLIMPTSPLLIAGYLRRGKVLFTTCHLVFQWIRVYVHQRIGFGGAYRPGCKCQIQPCILCWRGCPKPDFNQCVWQQPNCLYTLWQGDNTSFAMCAPSTSGHCEWTRIQLPHNYQSKL